MLTTCSQCEHESNYNLEKKKGSCVTGTLCSASKFFDTATSIYIPKDDLFKCFVASYKCWEWAEAAWIQIFCFWRVWGNYMVGSKIAGKTPQWDDMPLADTSTLKANTVSSTPFEPFNFQFSVEGFSFRYILNTNWFGLKCHWFIRAVQICNFLVMTEMVCIVSVIFPNLK